jgi:hypothetical protein
MGSSISALTAADTVREREKDQPLIGASPFEALLLEFLLS